MTDLRKMIKFKMPMKYDRMIHMGVILLMFFGSMMVASCSVGETISNDMAVVRTVIKQIVFVFIAYMAMVNVANYFSLEKITKYIKLCGSVLIGLLIICLAFDGSGGSKSWIYITLPLFGQMSIQPSEFMKLFMIIIMACTIEKLKRRNLTWWDIVKEPFAYFAIASVIIVFGQNDAGSFIVMALICAVCLLIASHPNLKGVQMVVTCGLLVGFVGVLMLMSESGMDILENIPFVGGHIVARFRTSANPWSDEYFTGMQLINSLYAFASGGWKGLGFGQSIQKMKYLPAASTDYILAITVEELGIFGFGIILMGYTMIVMRLFGYALKSKHEGYKIVYIGTILYIFIHFVFNVGGVTGLIPLTGIPLLFISAGASSLVSVCMAIGVCQALVSKEKREKI